MALGVGVGRVGTSVTFAQQLMMLTQWWCHSYALNIKGGEWCWKLLWGKFCKISHIILIFQFFSLKCFSFLNFSIDVLVSQFSSHFVLFWDVDILWYWGLKITARDWFTGYDWQRKWIFLASGIQLQCKYGIYFLSTSRQYFVVSPSQNRN